MKKYFVEKFNASDDSFRITELYKQNGEYIKDGELLFSIESSKADIDIEAIESGFLYFNCLKGESIYVGQLFYVISQDVLTSLDEIFKTKASVIFDGISISNKASILLETHKIEPKELNKKIIKELDVLEYLKRKESNEILHKELLIQWNDKIPVVIMGAGGGAKMCIDLLVTSTKFIVVGLLDDNVKPGTIVMNVPVIGNIKCVNQLIALNILDFVLAFGVLEKRKKRFELYKSLKKLGCKFPNLIHPKSVVENSVELGEGNVILAGANLGSCVKLGNLNYINNNALISHDCNLLDNIHIAPGAVLASSIKIESNVLVGMNSTIYFGLKIGESSTILNGLIINNDIERELIQKTNN